VVKSRAALLGALAVVAVLAASQAASARPQTHIVDDVRAEICVAFGQSCFAGVTSRNQLFFGIVVSAHSGSGVIQSVRLTIQLPPGLSWGSNAPRAAQGCSGTSPAVCTRELTRSEVGGVGESWVWSVVAERAGTYEIRASVTPTETDPDLTNNNVTFRVTVAPPTAPPPPTRPQVSASAVSIAPKRPRAGSTVAATVRARAGGASVRPTAVRCTATVGALRVRGSGGAKNGTATCVYRTPRGTAGRTLKGTISFRVRGTLITRRFSVGLR